MSVNAIRKLLALEVICYLICEVSARFPPWVCNRKAIRRRIIAEKEAKMKTLSTAMTSLLTKADYSKFGINLFLIRQGLEWNLIKKGQTCLTQRNPIFCAIM